MNKNQNKEGFFYASKLRLFLNEYGGLNLHEFCNIEKVSYTKMLNLLGGESYTNLPKTDSRDLEVHSQPELPIRELVIDPPLQPSPKSSMSIKRMNASSSKSAVNRRRRVEFYLFRLSLHRIQCCKQSAL